MYETILVPLDGSGRAEAVVPHAAEMAVRFQARIVLLSVEEPPVLLDVDEVIDLERCARERRSRREALKFYLAKTRSLLEDRGLRVDARVVEGPVVAAIIEAAGREGADLLAMASHGWSGRTHTFYGSVSAGVLNRIDRPLLLLRSEVGA